MSSKPPEDPELELDWGNRTRPEDRGKEPVEPAAATPSLVNAERFAAIGGGPRRARPEGGDPHAARLSPAVQVALEPLLQGSRFRVVQQRQIAEAVVDVEFRNHYDVLDEGNRLFLDATETGEGVGAFFLRQFFRSGRPFTIDLRSPSGVIALQVKRPFTFILSRAEVIGWDGEVLGSIQQRWRFFSRRLDLLSPQGRVLAHLHGPVFKPWTFQLMQGEREMGKIVKQWAGLFTEAITNADDFHVELAHGMDARLRQLVLAAAFLIDFVWFERRNR